MPKQRAAPALLAMALLLFASAVPAHRGHAVWTDISWTGDRFEIVHRMHLADAISVNRFQGSNEAIEAPRSLARVALYVEERFRIAGGAVDAATAPTVETIGAEIEDDFIFVYQEWVTDLPERFPPVENTVLRDIEPEAQSFIRIIGPGISEEREQYRSQHI
ncbi:MAG: DUF6702 family protein [Halieaceae bacterium]|nr:DUF6702 family protein [Halieaceae bacterium]